MSARRRIFAGTQLRSLRRRHQLGQADLARQLAISPSYLSQLEHDDRPLTPLLMGKLANVFPLDWQDISGEDTEQLSVSLREAVADPIFDTALDMNLVARLAEQQPAFARRFVDLHSAFRRASQRLEMIDEALTVDAGQGSRLPWEEVRDWFHLANNYVDPIDRAAERLAAMIGAPPAPSTEALCQYLRKQHSINVEIKPADTLRSFDGAQRALLIDAGQPAASIRFQIAYHVVITTLGEMIAVIAETAQLRSDVARALLTVGLANYASGALLMPYGQFRKDARAFRHDVDRLALQYQSSFEQTCHRLSTMQRDGERGLPIFFCRVDMAGNITKRHSATRLQFARFGGTCPLWVVHEAAAIPDRILVQHAETPDGARYVSIAKGLVKASGRFDRNPRRYAVALGCEVQHAKEFVYADGMNLDSDRGVTPIGVSCRICPRADCEQRAYPPNDQKIFVSSLRRGVVPYDFAKQEDEQRLAIREIQHPLDR